MAIRTLQTSVNPETEVTHSYMLTSRGANARAGSTHLNQDARSSSENVFRRLGCGVDLRDTLNRRRDQELSQQSAAQKCTTYRAPEDQGGISVEDFHRAIAAMKENNMELITAATGSPFNQEVHEARLPEGFKLLAIKAYDRKSNP